MTSHWHEEADLDMFLSTTGVSFALDETRELREALSLRVVVEILRVTVGITQQPGSDSNRLTRLESSLPLRMQFSEPKYLKRGGRTDRSQPRERLADK